MSAKPNTPGNRKFLLLSIISVIGFIAAIFVNVLFPQLADIKIIPYTFFGEKLTLDMNETYRYVLIGIILMYLGIAAFSATTPERRRKFQNRVAFRFAIGLVVALWDILGTKLLYLQQPFFPGPAKIVEAFLMETPYIITNTLYSLRLFTFGFLAGILFGIGTGILIGLFPKIYYWVFPVLKITGVIPAVAWMPFALTLSPTPFIAAVFLVVICAWFPIAFQTAQGIASTPKIHFEVARTLGAKTSFLMFRVAIPHALPNIFTGISMANGYAFTTLVMSEMMGQPGGLGYYINASRVWSAYYKVFAAIIVMAIMFSLIMRLIAFIQGKVLRWQKGLLNG
ncbi:MAG: ABC transporter permease subunit [Oscillospiraceae bacterium]|jgi:NitT/TauT family transport system permease protein|nr:ABC transporter permease subunit [Oscillospiraceae bacterium]